MKIKCVLLDFVADNGIPAEQLQLPDASIDPNDIRVMMISEVPPANPDDYFYSQAENPDYMKTTLSLFQNADVHVKSMQFRKTARNR